MIIAVRRRVGYLDKRGTDGSQPPRVLIAAKAAGRPDGEEFVQIEIDDGLQRHAGRAVAGGFWYRVQPGGILM